MRSMRWQVWPRQVLLVADTVLLQELRELLQVPPGQLPQLGGLAPVRLQPAAREPREGIMTLQVLRRGKEYLERAQRLLRFAKTMTDAASLYDLVFKGDAFGSRKTPCRSHTRPKHDISPRREGVLPLHLAKGHLNVDRLA